ncbi:MAG: NUDIX hydrolase [Candidatus Gastranaerophilales bacterium]|nr:NUDIX hydrolase [Candidatus Gastranaerophilales bacterium]
MNFEEKTLNSKVVYEGKVVTVLKDDVEVADGHKSFREVILHSGGVVVVAMKDLDTILFVKQYRYPLKHVNIELPAGKLEVGEDPNEACKRELEEETGYQAKVWKSLGYINTTPGICTEKLYLYLAQDLEYVGEHPDEGEILKCCEYKLKDVFNMIQDGQINDAKTICALSRAFCKGYNND